MHLLNPIWLTALTALAVPVLIHLWNIRPGKTLKVGSIRWFTEASPANSRSFKLLDILLLTLRCVLLALIALLLATPMWQRYVEAKKVRGWILIPEASLSYVKSNYKSRLDSLQKLGYQYHFFAPGFKTIDTAEHKLRKVARTDTLNYWQLIKQLPQAIPSDVPVHLFTPNAVHHFKGEKPASPLNITWQTFTPADSVTTWLAGAWVNPSGGFRVVQGTSKPSGISYQYFNLNGDGAGSPFNISIENGKPMISLKNQPSAQIETDTITMRLAIYPGKNIADANYLEAGLKAVEKFMQRRMEVKIFREPSAIPESLDWLFWLSDDDLKKPSAKNIFLYAQGKKENTATWIENAEAQSSAGPALHQIIKSKIQTGEALWTDGYGNPVLAKNQRSATVYTCYTRFNPASTDLVWDNRFPLWLLKLTAKPLLKPSADKRSLEPRQILPVKISGPVKAEVAAKQPFTITNFIWLALVLVLFAERWLAYDKQIQPAND